MREANPLKKTQRMGLDLHHIQKYVRIYIYTYACIYTCMYVHIYIYYTCIHVYIQILESKVMYMKILGKIGSAI